MTEFFRATSVTTDNGEIVEKQDLPIMQLKKLNGQGTLYKLTDANFESINAQREDNRVVNVDKFIRAVRSNFGTGHYNVSALTHLPMPNELREIGLLRVEVNGKVMITSSQHHFDDVNDYSIFICIEEGIVMELESWYGSIKKMSEENDEISEQFVELCEMVKKKATEQISHFFNDTMFDDHLVEYDKLTITRDRVYE